LVKIHIFANTLLQHGLGGGTPPIVTTGRSPGRADPLFSAVNRGTFYLPRGTFWHKSCFTKALLRGWGYPSNHVFYTIFKKTPFSQNTTFRQFDQTMFSYIAVIDVNACYACNSIVTSMLDMSLQRHERRTRWRGSSAASSYRGKRSKIRASAET